MRCTTVKNQSDPNDAHGILHKLANGAVQLFHDPLATGTADIQELSRAHEIVSCSKSELWHLLPGWR